MFRLEGEPIRPALVARADAQQITSLIRDADGQHLRPRRTPARLFACRANVHAAGSYESDIRDAATVASWGAIRWRAAANGGRVEMSTRSGNTAAPDDTWSAWSPAYQTAEGDQIYEPQGALPAMAGGSDFRRRRSLAGPDVSRRGVSSAERQARDRRPSPCTRPASCFSGLSRPAIPRSPASTIARRAEARQQQQSAAPSGGPTPPAPPLGRRLYQKGLQTFVWKAEDGNNDRLQYDVFYRREGETSWRAIKRELYGSDRRVGHDVRAGRHLLRRRSSRRMRRRIHPATRCSASARAAASRSTTRRLASSSSRRRRRRRRSSSTSKTITPRFRRSSIPSTGTAGGRCTRRMGFPIRAGKCSSSRAQDTTGTIIIRASDVMNNVATATAGQVGPTFRSGVTKRPSSHRRVRDQPDHVDGNGRAAELAPVRTAHARSRRAAPSPPGGRPRPRGRRKRRRGPLS